MITTEELVAFAKKHGLHLDPSQPSTEESRAEAYVILQKEAQVQKLRDSGVDYHKAFEIVMRSK